ncbi:MOSC N-terminal beta barrel domain-containing protein [Mycobacterium crocinum]|uniref:MOSC N-terminal beta barrel domain-containing protein n=1 Tax=Mycolicibacterium crocinum TaxID=388459 RepID=A0ABY3TCZ4_9MYCO|nr:MOSC N-terminal beta barrel domain-containing protein [Mycolicibacterium crocinum]MCV7214147.1 MOSC N-terminal beta barrel domain-containing protein [Mycolicibacterium crocinum]ULN39310.1 MOSC N-terminal beta barrel domain-containing protein [Mycolicibacterium crocinum]
MIPAGRITSIWRYPVKSMQGERVAEAAIGELGLHADRTWAVRDVELDATTSAKRLPGLLWLTARYPDAPGPDVGPGHAPEVLIGFPDGTEVSSSDPIVHQALSRYLDRAVELRPLPPLERRDEYRGPMATKTDLRTIFGLEDAEPLPDLSMFPVRKLAEISRYATPVGTYVDAYPVHIITEQSLATLGSLAPDSDFDIRRFRPTIVVDSPSAAAHPEWDWCGGQLHAPHAELQPLIPTIRCVMPSHEQPELKRDKEITRTIAAHTRRCLGVYGNVIRAGRLAEGDVLHLNPPNRTALSATAGSGAATMKRAVMRAVSAAMPSRKKG